MDAAGPMIGSGDGDDEPWYVPYAASTRVRSTRLVVVLVDGFVSLPLLATGVVSQVEATCLSHYLRGAINTTT